MKLHLPLLSLLALAACGDDAGHTTIDAPTAIDAAVPIDAPVCDLTGYPPAVRAVSVDLTSPTTLALDGTGTRCEQIVRALLGPNRPPELAQLDTGGVTNTCTHDDVTNREIVRLRAPLYAGLPVYSPVQDALVHVDAANAVVFLHGDFLPAGMAPASGCLDDAIVGGSVPGRAMGYERFAACTPQGDGQYTIAGDDEIEVGAEGVYLDLAGTLHRARAVDVYLLSAHVDSMVGNSDAYCCSGATMDHCVGQRLFIDTYTGATLGQEPHCHIC
jgi:hypothetical protein